MRQEDRDIITFCKKLKLPEPPKKISPSQFAPKEINLFITKEGNYTNGHWILAPEFIVPRVKERFTKYKQEKQPSDKPIWPSGPYPNILAEYLGTIGNVGEKIESVFKTSERQLVYFQFNYIEYLREVIPNFKLFVSPNSTESGAAIIKSDIYEAGLIMPVRSTLITTLTFSNETVEETRMKEQNLGYKEGGLEKKFIVSKVDGSEVDPLAQYFVLRVDEDPHALTALKAYAQSVKEDNPKLAEDLDLWITLIELKNSEEHKTSLDIVTNFRKAREEV
jgi:hypothetical protein